MSTLQENQSLNAEYERNKKEREMQQEIERLKKENNDLRKLYQRTYKHLFEKGNDELARYFQAQIDECPTFYVEPIIDYYEETKRLNSIIKEVREYIKNNAMYSEEWEKCCDDLYTKDCDEVLKILDKVEKENDIEFDVLKALNTDLDDDVEMG